MATPKHTVLVVDDSATMLLSLDTLLRDRGFEVQTASDGEVGLNLLKEGLRPSLIITDVAMPRMDGITFTREARKVLRFVPILVLTTESQRVKREEGRSLGATGWLLKPVDVKALLNIIDQILPNTPGGTGHGSDPVKPARLAKVLPAVSGFSKLSK